MELWARLLEVTHWNYRVATSVPNRLTNNCLLLFLCLILVKYWNIIGEGWCYSYDAVGSHEKVRAVCNGTGTALLQPVLDNQVEGKQLAEGKPKPELSADDCLELLKDSFTSTCERDIYTGDSVEFFKITGDGVEKEVFELRAD